MGNEENEFEIRYVKPSAVVADPGQPRKSFDNEKVEELADSIRETGLQQPPTCREKDGELLIIFGERRWRACSLIGAMEPDYVMPVYVRPDPGDKVVLQLQLIENAQREDVSPMEEARAFARLGEMGDSLHEIARVTGIPYARVQRRVKLNRLPEVWQKELDLGRIPIYTANLALALDADTVSRRPGISAMEDALEIARSARGSAEAKMLIERRYLRPDKESKQWEQSDWFASQRELFWVNFVEEFCEESTGMDDEPWKVLSYEESRRLFPFDIVDLLPMNAGDYVFAETIPNPAFDGLAPGRNSDVCWADLALRYGAPIFLAVDGKMQIRAMALRSLVREAAIMAAAAPEECIFLVDDAEGQKAQQEQAKAEKENLSREDESRAMAARMMLEALDTAIRERPSGEVHSLLMDSALFLGVAGLLRFDGDKHPFCQYLTVLGIDIDDDIPLKNWPGLYGEGLEPAVLDYIGDMEAIESLIVGANMLQQFEATDGDLRECEEWQLAQTIYQFNLK